MSCGQFYIFLVQFLKQRWPPQHVESPISHWIWLFLLWYKDKWKQKPDNTLFTSSDRLWISSRLLTHFFSFPETLFIIRKWCFGGTSLSVAGCLFFAGHRLQWSILGSVKNTRTEMGGSNGMGCSSSRCGLTFRKRTKRLNVTMFQTLLCRQCVGVWNILKFAKFGSLVLWWLKLVVQMDIRSVKG